MENSTNKFIRYTIGLILIIVALNAFGGGLYGLSGAKDVRLQWLEGSPYKSYFISSLILLIVVGGSSLFTAIAVFRNKGYAQSSFYYCLRHIGVDCSTGSYYKICFLAATRHNHSRNTNFAFKLFMEQA